MKTFPLTATLLLILSTPLAQGEIRIGYGIAGNIARASDIPGKNVPGQCLPFARALHARLKAVGIPSAIISYAYEADGRSTNPLDAPLSHAVVAYEDRGRTYIMDNQSSAPVWIHRDTAVAMAQRFSGPAIAVRGAQVDMGRDVSHIATSGRQHPLRQATAQRKPAANEQRLATRW